MAKTETKPESDEKVEAETEAPVETSAEEQSPSNPTRTKLKEVENKEAKKGGVIAKILALVVFASIAGGSYFYLRGGIVVEAPNSEAERVESPTDLDPSLTARELLQFGENALKAGDIDQAARFLEGARLRADLETTTDINLTVDVYQGLAKVESAKGNDKIAKMFTDYIHAKQSELGASLPLFNKAERLFRQGKHVEARKNFARFLLLANSLDPSGQRYIDIAKRHVADSYEIEYRERYAPQAPVSLTNPEEFFDEER